MRAAALVVVALALGCANEPCAGTCPAPGETIRIVNYHGDAARLGWNDRETELTRERVAAGLVPLWSSEPFEVLEVGEATYAPHLYASPLWIDGVEITLGPHTGTRTSIVVAATSNGWVYAVAAAAVECGDCAIPAGRLLWRTRLVNAVPLEKLDGGMPMGVLSTPIADLEADPPRLYVAALDDDGWQAFALDLGDGRPIDDWPVAIDDGTLGQLNTNGPATFQDAELMSQRGALVLSPRGDRLYVPFGTYQGDGAGWLAGIDTAQAEVVAAFSSAPWTEASSNGGIWGSGGPAVDEQGFVYATTGNGPTGSGPTPGVWANSLVKLDADLRLVASYTPWNYCALDEANMDLAGSQPLLLPAVEGTTMPLVAFGSKQGNVYLVALDRLTATDARPPCGVDPAADASLLPPEPQPQFGTRGPLNVFGPYSEVYGQLDWAKMRSKLAYYRTADGTSVLFASGSTKAAADSTVSVPPSLARLHVVVPAQGDPYLEIAAFNDAVAFVNPGSPVVSSTEGDTVVVWVVDENAPRVASLLDPATPKPALYAFDGATMELLWRSEDGALAHGGKYGTPVVAHGVVIVGTDRIQAFGPP